MCQRLKEGIRHKSEDKIKECYSFPNQNPIRPRDKRERVKTERLWLTKAMELCGDWYDEPRHETKPTCGERKR